MSLTYRDHWQCACGELFVLSSPIYICMFMPWIFRQADREYQAKILEHIGEHLREKLKEEACRTSLGTIR